MAITWIGKPDPKALKRSATEAVKEWADDFEKRWGFRPENDDLENLIDTSQEVQKMMIRNI